MKQNKLFFFPVTLTQNIGINGNKVSATAKLFKSKFKLVLENVLGSNVPVSTSGVKQKPQYWLHI